MIQQLHFAETIMVILMELVAVSTLMNIMVLNLIMVHIHLIMGAINHMVGVATIRP
ncbi:hypothetical protein RchiOBHm_Chr2g0120341 [Rosa chinensis]|uniref:Uncharacterized protein n=1 Tax=Rosa chinensis TaxID=74649 RepID=A0A2P6RS84_ROSCH|nr:hypothetical protein RchiOBHm_Chr2g0120341 [Rosa chinensis]